MKIKFIIFLFSIFWLALIGRVFYLAVESNTYYDKLSQSNTIKIEKIAPVRGEILDRNNLPIAINKLGFKIELQPHLMSDEKKDTFNEELDFLIKLLPQLDREAIIKNYKKGDSYYNHSFIKVVNFIAYEDIIPVYAILNLRDSINIVPSPKRFYPYNEIASHIIGYVARANQKDIDEDNTLELIGYTGKNGLEKYYNAYLQGEEGRREIKVNAKNKEIEELSYKSAVEDKKLTLNIDIELQKYISELFTDKSGAVVVMDVNGSILSASSYPEYNLNVFVSGMSQEMYSELSSSLEHPFTNKLVNGLYPPGSTIKTGLGLLYITTELDEKWSVNCESNLPLGGRVFRCWKTHGHGKTEINKAIRESCDDFFYKGSLIVGNEKMAEGLMRYGLGKKTGVDLPNEFIGVVPSREWKRNKYKRSWNIGETINTSIGQGDFLTTPMQIAQYTALMATGKLPVPHFAKMIGDEVYAPQPQEVLSEEELKKLPKIQKAMFEVCNTSGGTAVNYVKKSKVILAGKTGTAQVIAIKQDIKKRELEHEMDYYNRSHAWFTTYGPYKDPQYVVSVLVEHGGHGGAAAGDMVSSIYNKLLELDYIKQESPKSKR